MKKVILFAVLLLSISTFAQTTLKNHQTRISTSDLIPDGWMQNNRHIPTEIITEPNSSSAYHSQSVNHRSLVQKIDSSYTWLWDTQNNTGWVIWSKYVDIVYDNAYNELSRTAQRYNAGIWTNASQIIRTFDENNNMTSFTYRRFIDNAWKNYQGYEYVYDESGNRISELFKSWDNNVWVNYYRYLFTFDANNNMTNETFQGNSNTNWWNVNTVDYTYNAANKLLSTLHQSWNDNIGTNVRLVTNTYNTNNNITISIVQNWNGTDWQFDTQDIYTYDTAHKLISKLTQKHIEGQWVDNDLITYTYDGDDNRIFELKQVWYENAWLNYTLHNRIFDVSKNITLHLYQGWYGNEWVNYWQTNQSFDENNFTTSVSSLYWNGTGDTITFGDSLINYYQTVLVKTESMDWNEQIVVFPNPGNGRFCISAQRAVEVVEIRNISGQIVYTDYHLNQGPTTEIDLSNLSAGIYILKATAGNKTYSKKIIIQ